MHLNSIFILLKAAIYQSCLFPSETCNTWRWAVGEFAASLRGKQGGGAAVKPNLIVHPERCSVCSEPASIPSDFLPLEAGMFILSLSCSSPWMRCARPFCGQLVAAAASRTSLTSEKISDSSLTGLGCTEHQISKYRSIAGIMGTSTVSHIPAGPCGCAGGGIWCPAPTGSSV